MYSEKNSPVSTIHPGAAGDPAEWDFHNSHCSNEKENHLLPGLREPGDARPHQRRTEFGEGADRRYLHFNTRGSSSTRNEGSCSHRKAARLEVKLQTFSEHRKMVHPAVLDVQFTSIKLPNGTRRAINGSLTDLESSTGSSDNEGSVTAHKTSHRKAKFIGGGAAGGAVIGAIAGGGKGLAIGAGVGALTGAIAGRVKKGHEVKVKSGTEFGVIRTAIFTTYVSSRLRT